MATEKEMKELIERAMADAQFRAQLVADPAKVAADAGYTLTKEQVAALKGGDFQSMSEDLGKRLSKLLR